MINVLILGSFSAILYTGTGCSKKELDPNVELNKAVAEAESGNWEAAAKTAKNLTNNVKDNSDAYIIYGLTAENKGQLEEAVEAFKLAIDKDRTNFYGYYNAGRVYYKLKNYPEAVKFLQEALTLKSDNLDTKLLLAQAMTPQLLHKDAIVLYEDLAKTSKYVKSSEIYNQLGILYSRSGNTKKAFNNFKKAYVLDRGNPEAIYNLAIFVDNKLPNSKEYRKFKINLLTSYLNLTKDNSQLKERRNKVQKRIKKIMRPVKKA